MEEDKSKSKPQIKELIIISKMIDKNSIYAMKVVLPASQIILLKLNNNGFTYINCELMIKAIESSKITRLFFDWNPIPKSDNDVPGTLFGKM